MTRFRFYVFTISILFFVNVLKGQNSAPYFSTTKGLSITAKDSSFSITTRFRMQNRIAFASPDAHDLNISEVEARIRRLRLRFNGFVLSPRLTYLLQLSFSRSDMDYEGTSFPNLVRDAYIQYSFGKSLFVGLGQTKLPGNRQRLISSGDLQLADRSIVNSALNIDRDFGVFLRLKRELFTICAAVSSGEGRNFNTTDHGLAYTGRVELLPLGSFENGGDYFEGDLLRSSSPKLSIGLAYHFNENSFRTSGQTGYLLKESRDLRSRMLDILFKYKGWAFSGEYLERLTGRPIVKDVQGNERAVFVGYGFNYQLSYFFANKFEVVGKFSTLKPKNEIRSKEKVRDQFTLGLNKYFNGHRVKLQNDLTFEQWHLANESGGSWRYTLQIELGI